MNELIAVDSDEKVKAYENPNIKKKSGTIANYLYFYYINNSENTTLDETVKMKNRKYLEICPPYKNSDEFSVTVKPKTNKLVKFRMTADGQGAFQYSASSSYSLTEE